MPNKKGIYQITVKKLGKLKMVPSSIFPDNWDGAKIIRKIIEAYKSPIKIINGNAGETFIKGITKA